MYGVSFIKSIFQYELWKTIVYSPYVQIVRKVIYFRSLIKKMYLRNGSVLNVDTQSKRGSKVVKASSNNIQVVERLKAEINVIKEHLKNDISGPVVASFGFIIALVWRDAIRSTLDEFLVRAGLLEKAWIYDIFSALIVTIFVIFLMIGIMKFSQKKKRKKLFKEVKEKIEDIKN